MTWLEFVRRLLWSLLLQVFTCSRYICLWCSGLYGLFGLSEPSLRRSIPSVQKTESPLRGANAQRSTIEHTKRETQTPRTSWQLTEKIKENLHVTGIGDRTINRAFSPAQCFSVRHCTMRLGKHQPRRTQCKLTKPVMRCAPFGSCLTRRGKLTCLPAGSSPQLSLALASTSLKHSYAFLCYA